jgi:multisubunit Na+/H+ antiporter MnhC subunit
MNAATLFGLSGAALVGFGLYGLVTNPEPLRKILAFNLLGSGVFLVFGVVSFWSRGRSSPSSDGHYRDRCCLRGYGHGYRPGAATFAGNRPIHAQRR